MSTMLIAASLVFLASCATLNVTRELKPVDPYLTKFSIPTLDSVAQRLNVPEELQDDVQYAIEYRYGPGADGPQPSLWEFGTLEQRRGLVWLHFAEPWDMSFSEFYVVTQLPYGSQEALLRDIERRFGVSIDSDLAGDFTGDFFYFQFERSRTRQQLAEIGDRILLSYPQVLVVGPNSFLRTD